MALSLSYNDFKACCGSKQFAKHMVAEGPFDTYDETVVAANNIWFNKVDVNGWLEAFAAHPQIGQNQPSYKTSSTTSAQEKFGFVFLICASGRTTPEILSELKRRFSNRPIVEFEIAAQEQMKITELRLQKLFSNIEVSASNQVQSTASNLSKAEGRVAVLGGHLTAPTIASDAKSSTPTRVRPPITTHILDVARGCPAAGIEVLLEMYNARQPSPVFGDSDKDKWIVQGSSITDKDGRSGQLMKVVDYLSPGVYRITFNTGKYNPNGFFPFVSIVFEGQLSFDKPSAAINL
nr:uric acid degradation bifunctional protein TTL isoform X1 [Tanacetum cinerariifolium]